VVVLLVHLDTLGDVVNEVVLELFTYLRMERITKNRVPIRDIEREPHSRQNGTALGLVGCRCVTCAAAPLSYF
jgi:hypothetical protein